MPHFGSDYDREIHRTLDDDQNGPPLALPTVGAPARREGLERLPRIGEVNSNAIKPILVGAPGQEDKLSEIGKHWDNIASTETMDQFNPYDLYNDFKAVCLRLRKEVKRHKKSKLKLKELEQELVHVQQKLAIILHENETWRPIETAPKDGTRVLLFREGYAEDVFVGWYNTTNNSWVACFSSEILGVTHWRSLPKAG